MKNRKTCEYYDASAHQLSPLAINSRVRIQDKTTKRWNRSGIVVEKVQPRSYLVRTPSGATYQRNRTMLREIIEGINNQKNTPMDTTIPTDTENDNNKLRVFPLSCGGHDSDCVAKAIFDKPNSDRDLVMEKPYHMLRGCEGHFAAFCLPWPVIAQEGFWCSACEAKGRFCKVEQCLVEESERTEGGRL